MTEEFLNQANKISNELANLKGLGFFNLKDYTKSAESIYEISVYSENGVLKFSKEDSPELSEYVKKHIENMELNRQNRIAELEKQFAEL